ncbi:hypothetical protein HDU91_001119, partial [Kappamyces sp. JEL0680]
MVATAEQGKPKPGQPLVRDHICISPQSSQRRQRTSLGSLSKSLDTSLIPSSIVPGACPVIAEASLLPNQVQPLLSTPVSLDKPAPNDSAQPPIPFALPKRHLSFLDAQSQHSSASQLDESQPGFLQATTATSTASSRVLSKKNSWTAGSPESRTSSNTSVASLSTASPSVQRRPRAHSVDTAPRVFRTSSFDSRHNVGNGASLDQVAPVSRAGHRSTLQEYERSLHHKLEEKKRLVGMTSGSLLDSASGSLQSDASLSSSGSSLLSRTEAFGERHKSITSLVRQATRNCHSTKEKIKHKPITDEMRKQWRAIYGGYKLAHVCGIVATVATLKRLALVQQMEGKPKTLTALLKEMHGGKDSAFAIQIGNLLLVPPSQR